MRKNTEFQKMVTTHTYRSDSESKAITTLKSTKESPSGGEKLLRLLASGGASDVAKTSDTQAMNNVSLNFAQGSFINNILPSLWRLK